MPYIAPLLTAARTIKNLANATDIADHQMELGPMPIIIKTPSCPIAVVPPRAQDREQGGWCEDHREENILVSRFVLNNGKSRRICYNAESRQNSNRTHGTTSAKLIRDASQFKTKRSSIGAFLFQKMPSASGRTPH